MQDGGLHVRGLAVARNGQPILTDLGFTLAPGRALAVTGPNGIGKSSLLRALAGLLPPAAGEVALRLGRDDDRALGERLHYLGHGNGAKAVLTAGTNLRFLRRWGGGGGLSPAEALEAVGLGACIDIPLGFLSAGQRRRVAGLLVADRPLWLLDEPATALDRDAEAMLTDLLTRHLSSGGLAVLALHAPLALPMAQLRLSPA
ncbi:heme ABC exporter ATP-binding protein CcmA [Lichenihabitans sp. Uapishka_5]|uniref:heme ABC exporter ATP-binding protein CcmA n=1 Tax=Lichenihabitans sp. Uapishka_5 TaxID=3037302 RepID=UPI0029E7E5EB|nr:heme ABC exporter ATP-binding protein CcmA [Lichenihabitans sp. Uapishka_5]MDX7950981.1 heme ABC exporter ATP-binding protein CcmA [Lichenihabitans sp. Uapishka_5]